MIPQDVYNQESHSQSSCVYYLTREREGPPDGATPSYKVMHRTSGFRRNLHLQFAGQYLFERGAGYSSSITAPQQHPHSHRYDVISTLSTQAPLICIPARVVFVQEQTSDLCDSVYTDNFLDGSNSLSSDLSDAFRQTDFTDMTIVCDKREFHCHKFMLAARSEVFAAMLRHEFLEKQNSRYNSPFCVHTCENTLTPNIEEWM